MSTEAEIYEELVEWWKSATPDERRSAVLEWEAEVRLLFRQGDETVSDMSEALAELKAGDAERFLRQEAALRAEARQRHADEAEQGQERRQLKTRDFKVVQDHSGLPRKVRKALNNYQETVEQRLYEQFDPQDPDEGERAAELAERWAAVANAVVKQLDWLLNGDPTDDTYPHGM